MPHPLGVGIGHMRQVSFTFLGYITALFMDTQMSSPKGLKRIETEHIMDGHFIHFQNVIRPNNKES